MSRCCFLLLEGLRFLRGQYCSCYVLPRAVLLAEVVALFMLLCCLRVEVICVFSLGCLVGPFLLVRGLRSLLLELLVLFLSPAILLTEVVALLLFLCIFGVFLCFVFLLIEGFW